MKTGLKRYMGDSEGAVTIDWVVLMAAIVSLTVRRQSFWAS